ncbi:hypothetical protein K461DRAFT_219294 [Myriangium duriaei CBS 260.36]|uniref:Uncharacterized protein n=1 Tax=Myriangium duriaei CBS 260.36 TaxID=1168546 RepID=A0A9P4JBK5_9PEZI|nr:hypothetical protein K461DRAFT_219294 [Myriangium duriaei CBS 260.36]
MSTSASTYPASAKSSDSSQSVALDRWSQRRLQRLNTEQSFREQRQGGSAGGQHTPTTFNTASNSNVQSTPPDAPPQNTLPQPTQPQQAGVNPQHQHQHQQQLQQAQQQQQQQQHQNNQQLANGNSALHSQAAVSPPPPLPHDPNLALPPAYFLHYDPTAAGPNQPAHVPANFNPAPPDTSAQYQTHQRFASSNTSVPHFSQDTLDEQSSSTPMATPGVAPLPAPKPVRSNRQSIHNTVAGMNPAAHQQQPQLQTPVPPPHANERALSGNAGRTTPQPQHPDNDMTLEEVGQLAKDHKELREKYTKVKKYYFEKEEQVKQLQNLLAHQRIAQSRTSLDDSEYTTRLNRLDGLIAQLAFSIRKSWKTVPQWMAGSINKDAIVTGKQEMIAAGRAFISCWLADEVFDKYFHPDMDPALSEHFKTVQKNIRRFAPPSQTAEEEEQLSSKVVSWRLATLDGLQDILRSNQSAAFRSQLMEILKERLIGSLQVHLSDPPMSDLEGGVNMIIELAVNMLTFIPLESRDVVIEYFMPGTKLNLDMMKQENSIPALGISVAEDANERISVRSSADSDEVNQSYGETEQRSAKRSMLSAITGKKSHAVQGKLQGAGSSSGSLGRPESAGKEEPMPKVRMAVGLAASIRGKSVLVKAPVHGN